MKNSFIDYISSALCVVFTGLQLSMEQIENIISIVCLVLTIISVLITIVSRIVSWYKNAKKDNKIDEDEFLELTQILSSSTNELKNVLKPMSEDKK